MRITGNPAETAVATLQAPPDHLSFSQVQKLHPRYGRSCPRAWAYEKLLGVPRDSGGPGLHCGSALDRGASAYLLSRLLGAPPASAWVAADDAVRAYCAAAPWPAGTDTLAYTAKVIEGMEVLSHYLLTAQPASIQEEHLYSVRRAPTSLDDYGVVPMVGYSDWIETDGTIVDLKWTGTARWSKDGTWHRAWLDEKRDQLTTYWIARMAEQAAYGDTYTPAPVTAQARLVVVYHNLKLKTPVLRTIDLTLNVGDRATMLGVIREADVIANRGQYPARPGAACERCPHLDRCRDDNARLEPNVTELAA